MLRKIACNATNSAAVDQNGDLYVWGTTKYGLCGPQDSTFEKYKEKLMKLQAAYDEGNVDEHFLELKGVAVNKPSKLPLHDSNRHDRLIRRKSTLTDMTYKDIDPFFLLDKIETDPKKEA